jgi:hypothetical protein
VNGPTDPTIDRVIETLITSYNGATLSDGTTLRSTDNIVEYESLPDRALSFSLGQMQVSDWQPWQEYVTLTLPAIGKIAYARQDSGSKTVRQFLDDLLAISYLVKGLPVDSTGKLTPYSSKTADMVHKDQIFELVERSGPRISQIRVTESGNSPFARVDLNFSLEFVANYDPRVLKHARVIVVGVAINDPARQNQPLGWTPASPTADRDVAAWGLFNTPDPVFAQPNDQRPLATTSPPFPADGDKSVK